MLDFVANTVSAEFDENNVMIIAFSELIDEEPQHYFMIQDMLQYDEQDEELGQDTYYILRDDQQYGTYGGIHQITLSQTSVYAILDEIGRQALGVTEIKIAFQLPDEEYQNLKARMKAVFGERQCLLIEEQTKMKE
jgi:hypothetical protein